MSKSLSRESLVSGALTLIEIAGAWYGWLAKEYLLVGIVCGYVLMDVVHFYANRKPKVW